MRNVGFGLSCLVLVTAVAGCATAPVYPLMTPISVTQTYGYYEKPADGGKYEVSYVTPPLEALGYRFDASPTVDRSKAMAVDLATLRAAELAQQSGWQGFDIVDRHTSSDAEYNGGAWDGPWGPGYGPGWGPGWGHGWGWGWRGGWGRWGDPGWYEPPEQHVQAEAVLTVAFTNTIKSSDLRAADVIQQMAGRYPGVAGPTPPAPGTPAPPKPTI